LHPILLGGLEMRFETADPEVHPQGEVTRIILSLEEMNVAMDLLMHTILHAGALMRFNHHQQAHGATDPLTESVTWALIVLHSNHHSLVPDQWIQIMGGLIQVRDPSLTLTLDA
jgi:hypothetical protein